jgi:chromosome segregation ATPase
MQERLNAAQSNERELERQLRCAEQLLASATAASDRWQQECGQLQQQLNSVSSDLCTAEQQLCEAQGLLQQLQEFQQQYSTISDASRAAKRSKSQASYWQQQAKERRHTAAAADQEVHRLKDQLAVVHKVCVC